MGAIVSRSSDIYGPDYTMDHVCKGCQQRHRCASCLDGSATEYLPPSALARMATETAKGNPGCSVLADTNGQLIGFMCRRGR